MNPEERVINQQYGQGLTNQAIASNQLAQQQIIMEEQNRSMIKDQLDLGEELQRLEYLLKGYIKIRQPNGTYRWTEPTDKRLKIFSDYGVQKLLQVLGWYLNKNTLLSNYEEPMILTKMEDVATSIADNIFMKYELFFEQPTLEECKEELEARIKKRVDIKMFAYELVGEKGNEALIKKEVIKELEPIIEEELEKIRGKLLKDKLKDFDMIMRAIQDAIHSTYNRAWNGAERRTLRQHITITEASTPNIIPQQKTGGILGMFKNK